MAIGSDRAIRVESSSDFELQPLAAVKLLKAVLDKEQPSVMVMGKQVTRGVRRTTGRSDRPARLTQRSDYIAAGISGERQQAWDLLVRHLDRTVLERMTREVGMGETLAASIALLDGRLTGRTVIDVNR